MVARLIGGFLTNFSLIMLILAVVLALAISRPWRGAGSNISKELFCWVSLLAAGMVGLYTGVTHIFFPQVSAAEIGWAPSPFQFEVGMADLTIGVLGILAFRAGFGFRAAATVAATIFLGGDAVGHVRQMIVADNFAPGNAGPWFWTDILVPLVMIATLATLWWQEKGVPLGRTKLAATH